MTLFSRLIGACALVGLSAQLAAAQPALSLNTYLSYTDNLFQNHDPRSDWVTQTYFDLDYGLGRNVGLQYSGNASVFTEYGDLFSHRHRLGLSFARAGENGAAVYAGADLSALLDRPLYEFYDYRQASAYLAGKRVAPAGVLCRAGVETRYRQYLNASDYTHTEHSGYVQVQRSWQTGTTLQVRGELGVKRFLQEASGDTTDARARMAGARTLAQVGLRAKVAQAIGPQTGLQLILTRRANVAGRNRDLALDTHFEDLVDDRYAYSSKELKAIVKHVASGGVKLQASGRYAWRDYDDRPAMDLEGYLIGDGVWRADRRKALQLEGEKVIPMGKGWLKQIGVRLEWLYQHVDSNDPYYKAATQVYTVGVDFGF